MFRHHVKILKGRPYSNLMLQEYDHGILVMMINDQLASEAVSSSLASQTLSVPQHRSLSVCGILKAILKAIGAAERKGSGLRACLRD